MQNDRFRILYEKLDELKEKVGDEKVVLTSVASAEEMEEIDQLRKIVLETTEPETSSYTTT